MSKTRGRGEKWVVVVVGGNKYRERPKKANRRNTLGGESTYFSFPKEKDLLSVPLLQ